MKFRTITLCVKNESRNGNKKPLADAIAEDEIYDDNFKQLGRLGDRGAMLYSSYFEVNKNLNQTNNSPDQARIRQDGRCTTPVYIRSSMLKENMGRTAI